MIDKIIIECNKKIAEAAGYKEGFPHVTDKIWISSM
jgi:uncharacterized protein YihD (DUF1040 family)